MGVRILIWALLTVTGCSETSFNGRSSREQRGADPIEQTLPPDQLKVPQSAPPGEPGILDDLSLLEEVHQFKQTGGAPKSIQRFQGKKGTEVLSVFSQGTFGALDILLVIDNSPSMAEEQANLAPKLGALLSQVAMADWRIAVTTTDAAGPCINGVVSKGDPDQDALFATLIVQAETAGSGLERPFYKAKKALSCGVTPGSPDSWIRPDSALAVLIVTDEDNCYQDQTRGYLCSGEDKDPQDLLKAIETLRVLNSQARVYGIMSQPEKPCKTAPKTGQLIDTAVKATGGITGDICDSDYSLILREISTHVAKILRTDMTLEFDPSPGTMNVRVDGIGFDDYILQGRQVLFQEVPPFGSRVEISYWYGAEGQFAVTLQLPELPNTDTLSVSIEDQLLPSGDYRFDPQTKTVEFLSPPPEGAKIEARYVAPGTMSRRFFVGVGAVVSDSMRILVDGVPENSYEFNPETGEVTLGNAPREGADVTIRLVRKKT